MPLPHVKQAPSGQVFPETEIEEIAREEGRDLRRFDVEFDLPEHLTPEFPPPIFLHNRPELGDVSRGQVLTIKQLLRDHERHGHAGADGGPAAAAHAVPAGGVQPDRGPQGRRAEPGRRLPRLPLERPHQRRLPPHPGRPARRPRASGSTRRACAACSTSRSTARSARCARSRTSPSSSSAPPTSTATTISAHEKGRRTCPTARPGGDMAQMQNMVDFPPAPKLDPLGRLDPAQGHRGGAAGRAGLPRQGPVRASATSRSRPSWTSRCTT